MSIILQRNITDTFFISLKLINNVFHIFGLFKMLNTTKNLSTHLNNKI